MSVEAQEATQDSKESRSLFRNTAAQSAPVITTTIFGFLLAPVMLDRLGLAQFGVWAVTGALAQYARLLDLGVTGAIARFVALYDAEGDRRAIEETVVVGLMASTRVGLAAGAAAAAAAPLVQDVLGVLGVGEMRVVLMSAAGISAAFLIGAVVNAVPTGLRQMGPPNVANTAGNVLNFVFSIAALALSTDLGVYALANLAAALFSVVFSVIALLRVWRGPYLRRPTRTRTRTIVGFGVKSQLITLANLVNVQTDKLIIAAMLGPRTAGAYEIGNRVVQGVLSVGLLTLSAMVPTATADLVKRGRQVIVEYLERYTVRSLAIGFPLFGAVCVAAPYLLAAWLGEIPPDSVTIIVLLSFSFAVSLTTGVAMTLIVADGHPGIVAQTATLVVVLNVGATLVAAPIFGLWGVLVATVAAELVASAIFLVRFHRRYGLGARPFLGSVGRPAAVALSAALPFALWYLLGGNTDVSRPVALFGTIATGGVYFLACWLVESRLDLLPDRLNAAQLRRRVLRPG
ncbi:MAG TPA: lipopolysaccharide biosynthesis protein [Solirubrobacterales bacterium]|nr:lipopolysaccharide biosynthesis protein [Solirubrobacterales bacterium]